MLLAVSLFALVAGCGLFQKEPPPDALAVVGDEWLTREDVLAELETMELDTVTETEIARYVNRWIDNRLLLHEARQHGIQRDPELKRQLENLEQELMIQHLLEQNTVVDTPSSQAIVDYWKNHTGEYTRVANEVDLVTAYVETKNDAWRLREGFDQSVTATQMINELGVTRIDTLRNLSVDRLPPVIADAIEPLRSGHSSLPVEYHDEWMIIKLLERYRAGRTRPIEEVEPLVRARMMSETRTRLKLDYIEALRREARQSGLVRIRFEDEPPAQDTLASTGVENTPDVDTPSPLTEE